MADSTTPLWQNPDPYWMASLGYGRGRDSVSQGKVTQSAPVAGNSPIQNFGAPWTPGNVGKLLGQWWTPEVAKSYMPEVKDDDFINSILDERQAGQAGVLDTAKSRGQLTNSGYEAALANLTGDQRTEATSYVQDLLKGYNSEGIQKLSDYYNTQRTTAESNPYAFNFGNFRNDLNTKAQELNNTDGYKQSIMDSLGSNPLFDNTKSWQAATRQGVTNRRPANAAALTSDEKNPILDFQTSLTNFGV